MWLRTREDFTGATDSKESVCSAGDAGSIPGSERSPGERNGNPFQYPCLENSMDEGAWQATVHGVAKSLTRLSNFSFRIREGSALVQAALQAALLLGASSTRSKGYEEGGLAYAKAGSSLRSLPGNSRASTPKTRVCLLSALCSHLHL